MCVCDRCLRCGSGQSERRCEWDTSGKGCGLWSRLRAPSPVVSLLMADATSTLKWGSGAGVIGWWW